MAFLFKDYTELVLKDYQAKRNANQLSRLLVRNSTASLRKECSNVYEERKNRGEKEEEQILKAFFGVPQPPKDFGHVIKKFSADRFRPLQSFMNGGIKNPALATVELLAWLIDFKPRPLEYAQKMWAIEYSRGADDQGNEVVESSVETFENKNGKTNVDETVISVKQTEKLLLGNNDNIPPVEYGSAGNTSQKKVEDKIRGTKHKTMLTAGLVSAILFGGIYGSNELSKSSRSSNAGCMYWAGDQYVEVACSEDKKGRLFLPLEKKKINSFRMITRKDTITEWSIGKIFYIQDKNKIKYYTEGGDYPEDLNRSLRKLSIRIFEKDSVNRKLNN